MKEETAMDKITTDMAEHICGNLCRHPYGKSQEKLDEVCDECGMGQYMCDILNEYNRLNDFEKSQCAKLLMELGKYRWIPVEERLPEIFDYVLVTSGVQT